MLFNEDPLARKILLDALKQSENVPARVAVCRALSQALAEQKAIDDKEDFILPLFDILKTDFDESAKFAAAGRSEVECDICIEASAGYEGCI